MIYEEPPHHEPTSEQRADGERWFASVSQGGDLMYHVAKRLGISSAQVSKYRYGLEPVPDHLKEVKS